MTEYVIWDWNGTLLDDVELCVEGLNWLLAQFGYPQRYDRAAYQAIFGFPIEDYYRRAMYAAGIGAMLSAFAAGCAPGPMVRVLSISLAVLCAAYAVHFDGESRRVY